MGSSWSSARDAYARRFVDSTLSAIRIGRLTVLLQVPDTAEEKLVYGQRTGDVDPEVDVTLFVKSNNLWWRLCKNMDLGLSEAYLNGEVECSDWVRLFTIYIRNRENFSTGAFALQVVPLIQKLLSAGNTVSSAKRNAIEHYDSSNTLFEGFLSEDMNYSSPIWELGNDAETLEAAQARKVQALIQELSLEPSDHLLDIGCGWGNLAIEAVRASGCRVTGVTLSKEQKRLAEERIASAGFEDKIRILLCDYREIPEVPGGYDKVVSVEMIEHVGRKHFPVFFGTISRLLNPQRGVMVLQAIICSNAQHDAKLNQPEGFIDKYIFPGGYLASTPYILETIHTGSKGKLAVRTVRSIGPHYAKALRMWREKFLRNWDDQIKPKLMAEGKTNDAAMEFFKRRWEYYFSYCESGFRTGLIGDIIVTASHDGAQELLRGVPL
ncbi:cyclopropane-fatty-acyl-phospholipid synthase [Exidia glandulosa HHB12029]|uniref:Cyclopropane-fatty-acyl-phospholipid synthase n=1 Tax=Exidia glandulosa HHB12029 TaxID=1314781 RepID=A0A165L7R1_EXIGL|nr:cyclopropane-fatty-acyl-phospholipid synthase [Exidia glandulosa HHB12029]